MPRQKEKHKSKKYFSRNTPPILLDQEFSSGEKHQVYCRFISEKIPQVYCPPPQLPRAAHGRRALISIKLGGAKIFQTHCCLPHFRPIARNQDASQYVCEFRPVVRDQDVSQDPYQSAPPQTPRMHPSQQFYFELWARMHPRTDPKTRTHPFVQFAQNQHTY